jgi:hypothetical protein
MAPVVNLPPVSMTGAANFATGTTGVVEMVSTTPVAINLNSIRLLTP